MRCQASRQVEYLATIVIVILLKLMKSSHYSENKLYNSVDPDGTSHKIVKELG